MSSARSVGSRWLRAALLVTCGFAAGFLAHRSSVYERVRAWLSPLVDEPAHPKTAAILSREQSPWKGLDEASRTSARDVDQLAKRLLARHREWTATRAKDGAEAVAGYREALKEMLRRGGNEFPESGKSDDWHFFDGRSFAEELTDGSFVDLQEAVIRKVSQWMQRERIQPVVVFVPNPLDIHAHDLMPAVPASTDLLPLRTAMACDSSMATGKEKGPAKFSANTEPPPALSTSMRTDLAPAGGSGKATVILGVQEARRREAIAALRRRGLGPVQAG